MAGPDRRPCRRQSRPSPHASRRPPTAPTSPLTPASRADAADARLRERGRVGDPDAGRRDRVRRTDASAAAGSAGRRHRGRRARRRRLGGRRGAPHRQLVDRDRPRLRARAARSSTARSASTCPATSSRPSASSCRKFPGFADQAALDTKLDEVLDHLIGDASNGKQSYTGNIKPWFDGELAFSIGPAACGVVAVQGRRLGDGHVPRAGPPVGQGSAAAAAWFDAAFKKAGATATTETYNGTTVTVFPEDPGVTTAYALDRRQGRRLRRPDIGQGRDRHQGRRRASPTSPDPRPRSTRRAATTSASSTWPSGRCSTGRTTRQQGPVRPRRSAASPPRPSATSLLEARSRTGRPTGCRSRATRSSWRPTAPTAGDGRRPDREPDVDHRRAHPGDRDRRLDQQRLRQDAPAGARPVRLRQAVQADARSARPGPRPRRRRRCGVRLDRRHGDRRQRRRTAARRRPDRRADRRRPPRSGSSPRSRPSSRSAAPSRASPSATRTTTARPSRSSTSATSPSSSGAASAGFPPDPCPAGSHSRSPSP